MDSSSEKPKTSEKPVEKSIALSSEKTKDTRDSEKKKPDSPTESSRPIPKKKTTLKTPFFKLLILIIALIALVIALYSSFQMKKYVAMQNQEKQMLATTLERLESQGTQLDKAISQTQEKLVANTNKLQDALTQGYYQKQDWLLLKARNYFELAQIQANWNDDPKIAITLLKGADSILESIKSQTALPIRQSIAKEVAELEALPVVDVSGLLSQLDALQNIVMQLPISEKTETFNGKLEEKTPSSPWQTNFQKSLDTLRSLVVVKHYEGDLQPILSPLHQALLRENIRINLQQAEWAVLHKQTSIYQESLIKALQHVKKAFDGKSQNTQSVIQQLERLQKESLTADKPSLSQSLDLLNQWIDSEKSQNQAASSPEGEQTP